MKIKEAMFNEEVNYRHFYSVLQDKEIGNWDSINSTEVIHEYVNEMMKKGVHVSHIVEALEQNYCYHDDWWIWLGNSMETPSPINSKEDLVEALGLGEKDLELELSFNLR